MGNLNKTKLDATQCAVGVYDGVEEANRVIIVGATEFGIELSAADGDSISSFSALSDASASTAQTPATTVGTVLLTVSDVEGYSRLVVYSEALVGVIAGGKVFIQASPEASGSVWATIGLEVASPTSPGYAASPVTEFVAKRIRLVSSLAPTGGSVQYSVVLGS